MEKTKQERRGLKISAGIAMAFFVLVALYLAGLYNFLLFHSLAELFSVVIACSMFAVAWNSRRFLDNQYLLVIGIAYMFISILDLAHLLSYKGLGILPAGGGNIPTQLWIAARYLESFSLLIAPVMIYRRINPYLFIPAYSLIILLVLITIFPLKLFPDCFLAAAGGLTRFKIISEYVICLVLAGAAIHMNYLKLQFNRGVFRWMLASIFFTMLAELAFTQYVSVYGSANLLGHYSKIISFFCAYKAVVETGLAEPYKFLFRDLKKSKDRYESLFGSMISGFANHQAIFDQDGNPVDFIFLETNEAFERLTGLKDVVGKKATEVIPGIETDPADWIGTYGEVADTQKPLIFENYSRHLDRWYSISVYSPVRGKFATIFEDITDKKKHQKILQKSRSHFKLLSDISGKLLSDEDPRLFIHELSRSVIKQLNGRIFLNFLVDDAGQNLVLNAFSGITQEDAEQIGRLCSIRTGNDKNNGEKIELSGFGPASEKIETALKKMGSGACLSMPLAVQNNFMGILCFTGSNQEVFTPEETALVKTFSDYVAQALHRVQTRQKLKKTNLVLEQMVQKRTAKLAETVEFLKKEVDLKQQAEKMLRSANKRLSSRAELLRALTGKLTMVEQRERKRLVRVLHDGLQQHMVTAKFQLSGVGRQLDDGELKTKLFDIESMMGECIQMSRSLSTDMSPPVLHRKGLASGLKWIKHWMKDRHDFEVDLLIETNAECHNDICVLVFESLRELLFNVFKHSRVSKAQVRLKPLNKSVIKITVIDEGVGFDTDSREENFVKEGGFGLFSIRERINLIGGTFKVDSHPGKGTRVVLTVPVKFWKPLIEI